jgi:hypothetical protein
VTDSSSDNVHRLRHPAQSEVTTYHGPVKVKVHEIAQMVTFAGGEESDVLHAAAAWMAERPYAIILGLNWAGDQNRDRDVPLAEVDAPEWMMEMTVDMSHYWTRESKPSRG